MTSTQNEQRPSSQPGLPRILGPVVWRAAGLRVPRPPMVSAGLGSVVVYTDDTLVPGSTLEMELLTKDGSIIDLVARVLSVTALPPGAAARFDVTLDFVDVPREDRARLAGHLGISIPERASSVPSSGPTRSTAATGRALRVLFVTPYLPSPPRFGGQTRLHGLISGLAAAHDVSVLSLVDPNEDQEEGIRATGEYARLVVTVPNRRLAARRKRLLQVQSVFSARSYEWLLHEDPAFESVIDHLLAKERFDVVHFEFPHMASYRTKRAEVAASRPVFLLDEHNIEYDVVRQMAVAQGSLLRRAYNAINWKKMKGEERLAWGGLDGCTLTSARDQRMLLDDAPNTRTAIVPNGVDLSYFRPRAAPLPMEPGMLLFFGAIDYHPNTDGLLFFTKDVFPLLRAQVPGIKLCIVGRRPPPAILSMQGPDIEVTGAVDDLRPYLERAAVVIAPLRLGGGTRLKILEAMAMGKPVVSTTLGAEGLDVIPERDLLIADAPERFASQVRPLLEDPVRAARLGAAGRRVITANYGWGSSVARLSSFYREVLEARAAE